MGPPMPMDDLKDLRKKLIFFGGIVISLWHIYANTLGTMPELTTSALHYGLFAALLALILPGLSTRVAIGVGVLALSTVAYVILAEQALFDRGLRFSTWDWIFSLATIILVLELVRRTSGFFIPAVILVALSYVIWWGQYVSGVMQFPGLSIETMAFRSYFGSDGMFGPIARISSTFVFMFIL
ncbi:MAG: TRAP transporter permease, partial [Alphaproteobacteria bacterium]